MNKIQLIDAETLYYKPLAHPRMLIDGILADGLAVMAGDVPMKQIQEWLGHSDISTTANIYSHLDYKSKLTSANVMDNVLTLPETEAVGWRT